jgi:hypothetical protein
MQKPRKPETRKTIPSQVYRALPRIRDRLSDVSSTSSVDTHRGLKSVATPSPDVSPDEGDDTSNNENTERCYQADYEVVILGNEASGHQGRSGIGEGKERKEGQGQSEMRGEVHLDD